MMDLWGWRFHVISSSRLLPMADAKMAEWRMPFVIRRRGIHPWLTSSSTSGHATSMAVPT